MSIYSKFGTDVQKEKEGTRIVVDVTNDGKEVAFYIARKGGRNAEYVAAVKRHFEANRAELSKKQPSEQATIEFMCRVFADAVVKGWENVTTPDGKDLPYNKDTCEILLSDLPDLLEYLDKQAENIENFRNDAWVEDEKN